jgi:hypothetical protein
MHFPKYCDMVKIIFSIWMEYLDASKIFASKDKVWETMQCVSKGCSTLLEFVIQVSVYTF